MESYAEILEHELESAVEVKNKDSLHRVVTLITENTVGRQEYRKDIGELKSDVKLIAERMQQGFKRMDERFESALAAATASHRRSRVSVSIRTEMEIYRR